MAFLLLFNVHLLLFAQIQKPVPGFHQWAATPPMGWNSWDCYGPTVTEAEVKANADYMSQHLKNFGWQYIIVDIRWYVANDKSHGYNETDPDYSIDKYGRFTPSVTRFPSAANGKGFKPLADYIHSKGLKFGIHIMRGIPVVAVNQNLFINGTNITAKEIYSNKQQCTWLHDMYTIDGGKKGAQDYYNSIFHLYASWGLDFVKVDDLTAPYHQEEVEMIRKAINTCGRKIVLSTSPGETPVDKAKHVQQNANMWRTVGDFWDSWAQLKEHFAVFERWNKWRAFGAYPDGDMLPLGHIGIRAERGDPRMTAFTKDEQYTLLTLMAIFRSPLMFGGDLPGNDDFTLSLLTNTNVLHVLNNSKNNKELFNRKNKVAWVADDAATKDKYLAVFNIADQQEAQEEKAIWNSGLVNKATPEQSKRVDTDITGAKKLYLVVTNGGDDISWDHADWIEPVLYNSKDSISLTSLRWQRATAGWEQPRVDTSVSGGKLIVDGKLYSKGIGTHSNSIIEYDIPAGYTHFKALTGLDVAGTSQNTGATVKFLVFTENPAGETPPDSVAIAVSLKDLGIKAAAEITNLWTGERMGSFTGIFSPVIRRHACGLYKISERK